MNFLSLFKPYEHLTFQLSSTADMSSYCTAVDGGIEFYGEINELIRNGLTLRKVGERLSLIKRMLFDYEMVIVVDSVNLSDTPFEINDVVKLRLTHG